MPVSVTQKDYNIFHL